MNPSRYDATTIQVGQVWAEHRRGRSVPDAYEVLEVGAAGARVQVLVPGGAAYTVAWQFFSYLELISEAPEAEAPAPTAEVLARALTNEALADRLVAIALAPRPPFTLAQRNAFIEEAARRFRGDV